MKIYKVKLEGVFLKVNFDEGRLLSGVIAVHFVAANNAIGAVTRARLLMLDQLKEGGIEKIGGGLLSSFGIVCGVWELEGDSAGRSNGDPGMVFYTIGRIKILPLLAEKLYYKIKKPNRLFSF